MEDERDVTVSGDSEAAATPETRARAAATRARVSDTATSARGAGHGSSPAARRLLEVGLAQLRLIALMQQVPQIRVGVRRPRNAEQGGRAVEGGPRVPAERLRRHR